MQSERVQGAAKNDMAARLLRIAAERLAGELRALREAAVLAAVLPNPIKMHVDSPSAYVMSRREWILGQMRDLGGAGYLKGIENENAPPAPKRRASR